MTDYFALLHQPRQPWLDLEELKQVFHETTLRAHPDTQSQHGALGEAEAAFAQVNEAYQVLRDSKQRLHHLLTLEGEAPSSSTALVPHEIEEFFPVVAALAQEADALRQKAAGAGNALSRSLVKPELLKMQERVRDMLQILSGLHDGAVTQLQLQGENWRERLSELHALYLRFSYLTRWMAELEEVQLQLSQL